MKLHHHILFIFIILLVDSGCKKGNEECTIKKETKALNLYLAERVNSTSYDVEYGTIPSHSYIKYNEVAIRLNFDLNLISDNMCSTPTDSVVGNIKELKVLVNYYNEQNDSVIFNALNNNIKVKIEYSIDEELLINQSEVELLHPRCNANIKLFLTAPTDTSCLQSFEISYKETDGTIFKETTESIFITE